MKDKELSIRLKTMLRGLIEEQKCEQNVNIFDLVLVEGKKSALPFGSVVLL